MRDHTLFGACADYLSLSHYELASFLSDDTGAPFSPNRAKLVCEGREPVPAFAWYALREANRTLDDAARELTTAHNASGRTCLFFPQIDFKNTVRRQIIVRAVLKLPGGQPAKLVDAPSMW